MPFGTKIAASLCDAERPLVPSAPECLEACSIESSSKNRLDSESSDEASQLGQDGRGKSCLYNLIKSLAKVEDQAYAQGKLGEAAARVDVDLDKKNSKGSTALHACAYLKRWDLAQVLMDAGADPLVKNTAGHTFFLCAVKDEIAPWRELFKGHRELMDKHQRYLERGRGKMAGGGIKGKPQCEAHDEPVAKSADPVRVISHESSQALARTRICELLDLGKLDFSALCEIDMGISSLNMGLLEQVATVLDPEQWAAMLGHDLPIELGRVLIGRLMAIDDFTLLPSWVEYYPRYRPVAGSDEYLQRLLSSGRLDEIKLVAIHGMRANDDFIEECEERGLYDLADYLIDHNSENPVQKMSQALGAGAKSTAKARVGKKSSGQHAKNSAPNDKKRPAAKRSKSGRPSNRASKIANLDGPLKEANEFEYQEKKAPAKATIVIIKKARPLMARGDLAAP